MELDQFMKELPGDFLKEIIELFFPNLAGKLNFSQKKDLNKELYTGSPEGEERFVDVLLEVGYKSFPLLVLISLPYRNQNKSVCSACPCRIATAETIRFSRTYAGISMSDLWERDGKKTERLIFYC